MCLTLIHILDSVNTDPDIMDRIVSFLSPRRQYTSDGDSSSTYGTTLIGTPQGFVISPFLFTTYISCLQSDQPDIRVFKYADDIVLAGLFEPGSTNEQYFNIMQQFYNSAVI